MNLKLVGKKGFGGGFGMGTGGGFIIGLLILILCLVGYAYMVSGGDIGSGFGVLMSKISSDPLFFGVTVLAGYIFGYRYKRNLINGMAMGGTGPVLSSMLISAIILIGYAYMVSGGDIGSGLQVLAQNITSDVMYFGLTFLGGLGMGYYSVSMW